jgi:hypothetical protein
MEPIMTAGLDGLVAAQAPSPRREHIRSISKVLANQAATEDERLDALEALVELSKE